MSATKIKFSTHEPADRPYQIALSAAEILALAQYHRRRIVSTQSRVGKSLYSSTRRPTEIRAIHKIGKDLIDAHCRRINGLVSILK
jgi:hypothetical protein